MIWVVVVCGIAALVVAPAIAAVETWRLRRDPDDIGFWVFARQVEGRCQVRWGRGQSPIVRLPLPGAEGRARVVPLGRGRQAVEVRAWLAASTGFAARVASPPQAPNRWHAPGLAPVELEEALPLDASVESTDPDRIARVLARRAVRDALAHLADRVAGFELRVNGGLVGLQVRPAIPLRPGAAMEALGGVAVDALRVLAAEASELAGSLLDSGEAPPEKACAACGVRAGDDPWICPACAGAIHRGCREMVGGCARAGCRLTADADPGRGAEA
ncbi:MAG: hypothetical protein H6706_02070 [Myxococcales bacterium]|nr:hypothetical protein [Myxococcales bacterium]